MNNPVYISTVAFDGHDLGTAIAEIAALGADGVEVAFIEGYSDPFTEDFFSPANAHSIRGYLDDNAISCPSFSSHMDLSREGAVGVFSRRMEFAKMLGADSIISNAAPLANREVFLEHIGILGQKAAALGLTILLENPGDGKFSLMDTGAGAADLIREIGLASVRLNYDFGNLISHRFEQVRPEDDFQSALEYTAYFHIKDVVRWEKGWRFSEIGRGMIDYATILKTVAADPRPLPLSIELPVRLSRAVDASPIRATTPVSPETARHLLTGSLSFIRNIVAPDRGSKKTEEE